MSIPPVFVVRELYDVLNIRTFLKEVKAKEQLEAARYGKAAEVKGFLESLGIDADNADRYDFATRMKIKMLSDI